jgi:hypothetical protein
MHKNETIETVVERVIQAGCLYPKYAGEKQKMIDGKVRVTVKGAKVLANELIEDGSCTNIGRAQRMLEEMNKASPQKTLIVLCSNCARKFGTKKCAKCLSSSQIRYCSKECQVADWPSHRLSCP